MLIESVVMKEDYDFRSFKDLYVIYLMFVLIYFKIVEKS